MLRVLPILLLLAGCAHEVPVVRDVVREVKVPVREACMGERPAEPIAVRDVISRSEWDELTTDQREKVLGANGVKRKVYGDKLTAASAGCL